jgi:hypothetical protein
MAMLAKQPTRQDHESADLRSSAPRAGDRCRAPADAGWGDAWDTLQPCAPCRTGSGGGLGEVGRVALIDPIRISRVDSAALTVMDVHLTDAESSQERLPTYSGAMSARWLAVILTAAAFIAAPLLLSARPATPSDISAAALAGRVRQSVNVGWSGYAETSGSLQVPDNESFATLAQMLSEKNQLRVWWRNGENWRVDRIRATGETDLFRQQGYTIRWVFESQTATFSPDSKIRLPDASDLLPPTLARWLMQGAHDNELSRLPTRRVAGIDAPGLRLMPDDPATTIARVDMWVESDSGLPLQVELYGVGEQRPVLTTTLHELSLSEPAAEITDFTPADGVRVNYEQSVDVVAAANAFAPYDLPASLAGLNSRDGEDPGAVGVYGRGATTLIALPLRGRVAGPLQRQLSDRGNAQITDVGTLAPVGPVGLLITPYRGRNGAFLLAGTVNSETLRQAATELLARA